MRVSVPATEERIVVVSLVSLVYVPCPRIHCGSSVTISPGVMIACLDRERAVIGFVAGVASRAISTPLSVVTVRLQTSDDEEDGTESEVEVLTVPPKTSSVKTRRPGFREVLQRIYAEESLSGFWAGSYHAYMHVHGPSD